ncbi:NAD(P)H-dependent oxidoreductase [Bosea sp. (in: a-proteobacteria)]|uniref:FMN-dependent NADH-azoreductase n=1 Tax=Bosea sp. (in: a-proteobacteria) TaxID=1871050 RepID=UPI0012046741|nr:NAD(P)H-dependent oxidoreductase [Bosea sp. (in: a-proteobacteria)]TAJ34265.1 MAG: FMN-dependent NADH-azoreductase [Bosea sp. (in: a-proteobacteria)]
MKLLHLDSSILGENSASRELSAAVVARMRQVDPSLDVTYRDLAANPLPHLSGGYLAAAAGAGDAAAFADELADSSATLDAFLGADIVVIGAPMYNFGIPSQLKAWIDRIAVAGKTFRYTEKGPEGLAGSKRIVIASARGGVYAPGAPAEPNDFQENYLRAVFSFLGVTDLEIIRAEGLKIGPEQMQSALAAARQAAAELSALAQAA